MNDGKQKSRDKKGSIIGFESLEELTIDESGEVQGRSNAGEPEQQAEVVWVTNAKNGRTHER